MIKKIAILVVILAVIGGGVGYYMYNKPHKDVVAATPAYTLSSSELLTDFENNEAQANEKYLDQVVQVTGEIRSIKKDPESPSLTLETDSPISGVICQLEAGDVDKISGLNPGQTLTVKGICTGMLMDVVLVRCHPIE